MEEYKTDSFYEKVCRFFGKAKIPLPQSIENRIQEEIDFCHLNVTPTDVFSTAILLPLVLFFSLVLLFVVFNILSTEILIMTLVLSAALGYYLFSYTHFLTIYFRSKAASEMTLSVIYMAISIKISQNLESAIYFTASNLTGPLGLDFKKILWEIQTGKYTSAIEGLDWLAKKWRNESEEFVNALSLLKSSIVEDPVRMDKDLEEAVDIMLTGTKQRMKKYAMLMKTPLNIINSFGILLPLLALIFVPVMIIFIPEIAKTEMIAFFYTVMLPAMLFFFLSQYYYTKPYSYHQIEIKNTERYLKQRIFVGMLSSLLAILSIGFFWHRLSMAKSLFSTSQFIDSLLLIVSAGLSIVIFAIFSSFNFLKKNEEIEQVESELPVALFQLGIVARRGYPLENVLEEIQPRITRLKIKSMFEMITNNIRSLGATLEEAVFDKNIGAINSYPSRIISASMKVITDLSKRGSAFVSIALESMSRFLRDADEVSKATDEILSDVTSEMQVINMVFAPITAGIVVGLMAIVIYLFAYFGQSLENVHDFLIKTGMGSTATTGYDFLFNITKQIPFPYFQLIVGIYMIEVVSMLSYFLGEIRYGDDEVRKMFSLGKSLLIALAIYSFVVSAIYFGVSSLLNVSQLGELA